MTKTHFVSYYCAHNDYHLNSNVFQDNSHMHVLIIKKLFSFADCILRGNFTDRDIRVGESTVFS